MQSSSVMSRLLSTEPNVPSQLTVEHVRPETDFLWQVCLDSRVHD